MSTPFVQGAKVAIVVQNGWRIPVSFKAGVVAKVFKNGNFTLDGSAQQWRPSPPSSSAYQKFWSASETGSGNGRLRIWDETTAEKIDQENAMAKICRRFLDAQHTIQGVVFSEKITEEIITQMESVVALLRPPKESANG